jgi:D-alanyl-D-alanine carboxypeptidase
MISGAVFAFMIIGAAPSRAADTIGDPLQTFLASYVDQAGLPGAVVGIAYPDGSTRFAVAGLANALPKIPMQRDRRFYIGSLTKMMTAVVVLQMASEGKIRLSDRVETFFAKDVASHIANAHEATIRDLLHNSSGIPDYLDGDFFFELVGRDPHHGWRSAELLPLIADREARFPAGTKYDNSNSNYLLLGAIIESVEHDDIGKIFARRIFTPLGMANTSFGSFPRSDDLARGYDDADGDGSLEDVTDYDVGDHLADGGVVSTAADMLRFSRGLFLEGKLLGPKAIKRMTSDTMFAGEGSYGYGLMVGQSDWGPVWGHDGTYFGYSAEFSYFPDQKTTVVFLANGRAINDVPRFTQKLLPGLFGKPF